MKKPHLLFLHQFFYPEVAGSALRLTDLAIGLRKLGFPVTVLTGLPSYAGAQSAALEENYEGVVIRRLAKTRFPKNARSKLLGCLRSCGVMRPGA